MRGINTKKRFKTLAGAEVDDTDVVGVADKGILDLGDGSESDVLVVGLNGNSFPEERSEEGLEGFRYCGTLDEVVGREENLDGIEELWDGQDLEHGGAVHHVYVFW